MYTYVHGHRPSHTLAKKLEPLFGHISTYKNFTVAKFRYIGYYLTKSIYKSHVGGGGGEESIEQAICSVPTVGKVM